MHIYCYMRKLIKKILKEDFDWVMDTPALNPLDEDWVIIFNGEKEYEEIQKYLFSHNLCWDGHFSEHPESVDCGEPWSIDGNYGFFFKYPDSEHSGGIDAYSYSDSDYHEGQMEKKLESNFPNHKRFNWSDIGRYLMKEDFDWVEDIDHKQALKRFDWMEAVAQAFTGEEVVDEDTEETRELSDREIESKKELLQYYLSDSYFPDVKRKGDRIILSVGHWEDFVELFEDCSGGYNYMCQGLAKAVLAEDEYYEPYYDVVQDWSQEVWGEMTSESKKEVIDFIREKYLGQTTEVDGEDIEITEELLQYWSESSDALEEVIRDNPDFEEIKLNLERAYESAYNDVVRNQIWSAAHETITDIFGEGEWVSYEVKKQDGTTSTRQDLEFDITNIFWDVISAYFQDYCDLGYDRQCDFEYGNFLDNCRLLMYEDIWEDELNPRFEEYPDYRELSNLFNEMIGDYLYW